MFGQDMKNKMADIILLPVPVHLNNTSIIWELKNNAHETTFTVISLDTSIFIKGSALPGLKHIVPHMF